MKINMNNEIGEKDTKQVISSFKRLVRYVLYTLSQDLLDKKDKSLEIAFDNNEQFYVGIAFTDNKDEIIAGYTYFDAYGNELEEISLQQILNINKYSLTGRKQEAPPTSISGGMNCVLHVIILFVIICYNIYSYK